MYTSLFNCPSASRPRLERLARTVVVRSVVSFCLLAATSMITSSSMKGDCSAGLTKCARILSRASFSPKASPIVQREVSNFGAIISITSTPKRAKQHRCGPREKVVQQLSKRFSEHRKARGLVSAQVLMELFASKRGTWTVILSTAQGVSCILAAGGFWQPTLELAGAEA